MTRRPVSAQELEAAVSEFHHVQSEHRHTGIDGSVRRHLHARLLKLEGQFERVLTEWVADEEDRRRWRERFHHGGRAPAEPAAIRPPLAFKGRSEAGSIVEVLERGDGDFDVLIDGTPTERISARGDFASETPGLVFRVDGFEFHEIFDVAAPALAALRGYVGGPVTEPPWPYAHELAHDGLIDRDFSLTPRGRRALSGRRAAAVS